MPQFEAEKIYFSHAEILEALNNFNQLYKSNKIKEKINYQIWKKLKSCIYGVNVEYCYSLSNEELLMFFEVAKDKNGNLFNEDTEFCSFDIYNSDFGVFFATNYYYKHPDVISDAIYDDWEAYDSMKVCASNAYSNSSGNQTLGEEKINYWDYNNLSVGTTTGKTYQSKDYSLSVDTNTASIYGEIATQKYVDKSIKEAINEIVNEINEKEKDSMKGFNFDFGPCTGDNVRMSMYGLAVKNNNGEWVSYNPSTKQIVNVDILNFDGRKFMFKMPVAIKDIAVGDIVVHNRVPMFVIGTDKEGGAVTAVDVKAGEEKKILPTTSPFGFNFVTKVVSMFTAFENTPTPDAPFGNFLPFMLMNDENAAGEPDPLVMMMMLQNSNMNVFNNPMAMMYFLGGEKVKDNWMLPFLMMNQVTAPATPNNK